MAKQKDNLATPIEESITPASVIIENREDGLYMIDGEKVTGPLQLTKDTICYVLPKNSANRQWLSVKKAEAAFKETDQIVLEYKESKHFGPNNTPKMPNASLVQYLDEADKELYNEIINRAKATKEAESNKELTELEKAEAKLAKAKIELAKLDGTYVPDAIAPVIKKALIDYMSEEDYKVYTELLEKATTAKENAPKKERTPRSPMTVEQKKAAVQARLDKAQKALDALLAAQE